MYKKATKLFSTVALLSMLTVSGAGAEESTKHNREIASQAFVLHHSDGAIEQLNMQSSLLEKAIAPVSVRDAANKWAKALSERNGAYQYALFTESYKKTTKPYFESEGWITGGSSPWVNDFKIKKEKKINNSTYTLHIEFILHSSSGYYGKETATLTVKQFNKHWYIDKVNIKSNSTLLFRTPYEKHIPLKTYKTDQYSFFVPASWANKYTVMKKGKNRVFKYVPENNSISQRTLFSIDKIPKKVWEKDGYSEGLYRNLGEKNGYVFAMLPASENQYADRPNSVEYKEFDEMSLQFKIIQETFKINQQ
jgi:hypothetical protein